ncbi:MAG: hypothetical protein JOZ60_07345 [Verrucomicrobia bacterium]|nr:hypothetical protein [Verrucomicrobiota bacterium]
MMINQFADRALEEFDAIIKRRWHLVEPAQIITFIDAALGVRERFPSQERREMAETLMSQDFVL